MNEDLLSMQQDEIMEAVKNEKVYAVQIGRAVYTLEWSEIAEEVHEKALDALLDVIVEDRHDALYLMLMEELQERASELALEILEARAKEQQEQNEVDCYECTRTI